MTFEERKKEIDNKYKEQIQSMNSLMNEFKDQKTTLET
jgi:hypothetical protein